MPTGSRASPASKRSGERLEKLTDKEREVLGMIRNGRPNKEIAARLEVTPRAVELRRASLMRKLGVRSLPDLLRLTIGHEPALEGRPGVVADCDRRLTPLSCANVSDRVPRNPAFMPMFRSSDDGRGASATLRFCEEAARSTLRSSVKKQPIACLWHGCCLVRLSLERRTGHLSRPGCDAIGPFAGWAQPVNDAPDPGRARGAAC